MPDIEIKCGYEVLSENNIRFGIRITNISELAIFDVEVILDFADSLFKLEGERLQKIGVIPSGSARTAEFELKPLGCVHKVNIEALITCRDAKSKKYRIDMHPKEVHCVCPFLKGKKMPRVEFLELSSSGHSAEMGLNFRGVTVDRLTSFLEQTCKSRLSISSIPWCSGRPLAEVRAADQLILKIVWCRVLNLMGMRGERGGRRKDEGRKMKSKKPLPTQSE